MNANDWSFFYRIEFEFEWEIQNEQIFVCEQSILNRIHGHIHIQVIEIIGKKRSENEEIIIGLNSVVLIKTRTRTLD